MNENKYLLIDRYDDGEYMLTEHCMDCDCENLICSYDTLENAVLGARCQMNKVQYTHGLFIDNVE